MPDWVISGGWDCFHLPEVCGEIIDMKDDDCGCILIFTTNGIWQFEPISRTLSEFSMTEH